MSKQLTAQEIGALLKLCINNIYYFALWTAYCIAGFKP
jgi:hypothetical protein